MPEDFNQLRLMNKKLVGTPFQKQWEFRLEIEGEPAEFDLYVKDISYGPWDISTDDDTYGSATYAWPKSAGSVKLSATVRDNRDRRISTFVDAWCAKAIHPDGTVGLPYGNDGYLRKVRKYITNADGTDELAEEWEMYALTRGEVSQSRESPDFLEFPVVFIQLSTSPNVPSSSGMGQAQE